MKVLLLGALVLLAAASTASASYVGFRAIPGPRVECPLPGAHFNGTTAQKQKICLTVSASGTPLVQYGYGTRLTCSGGKGYVGVSRADKTQYVIWVGGHPTLSLGKRSVVVRSDGTFADTLALAGGLEGTSVLRGRINGKTAAGTLRLHFEAASGYEAPTCDTKAVRWTARSVGK